jgi:gamma-glutamylcyclotransferase (GGCT)/AIG2-like uncharacterized protein YtfP
MAPERDKVYLFVYGTLRRGEPNEMSEILANHGRLVGPARFHGRLFLVDHYPGAVDSDAPNAWVYGEIYELRGNALLLHSLDKYEECGPEFAQPNLYRREKRTVVLEDGRTLDAWIYVYNRPIDGFPEIHSGDFVNYLNGRGR